MGKLLKPNLRTVEEVDSLSKTSILNWISAINLKTGKRSRIEFSDHAFLVQPLTDWVKTLVFKKCIQAGLSTLALLKISYKACLNAISVIYTLPSTGDVRKFTAARLDPMIENSPYLIKKLKPQGIAMADSTEFKRLGESFLYFRGSWAEHQAQSIDADILVIDELDFSKPDIVDLYE